MKRRDFLAGTVGAALLGQAPAALAQLVNKPAEQLANGEFNWHPERSPSGPLLIVVSLPDQLVHVYRNGVRIAASTCSTGKPGHGTPSGVFKILQKDKHHHSSTYNNAPMPNMNRLTWSGVALHAGNLPGYPASHGCVRLPLKFSELLFGITRLGVTVVIADAHSQPASVIHPGLVLGDYARHEFDAVDAAVKHPSNGEGHHDHPNPTSVVVSGTDRRMTVWEGHRIAAEGPVEIAEPHRPLPESVHKLVLTDPAKGDLHWTSMTHGTNDHGDLGRELRRIKAEPSVREEMRKRMHHGMTLVTTHGSSTEAHRTEPGFVIMDGIY